MAGYEKKKVEIIILTIVIFFMIAFGVRAFMSPSGVTKEETAEVNPQLVAAGLAKVDEISRGDVGSIEEKIRMAEKFERLEQIQAGNFNVIFDRSVFMGDSHLEGLSAFRLVEDSRVLAVKGRSIKTSSDVIDKARVMRPAYIFMNYGMNDAAIYGSDVAAFIEAYSSFIDSASAAMPDAKIYVCSVFNASPAAAAKKAFLQNIPAYNAALAQMCAEKGITFIDTSALLTEEYYEPDGVHTGVGFHKLWLKYIAGEAGLLDWN